MGKNTDFNIPVEYAGIKFRNPFYVSSGPTTMTVEQLQRISETGWGGASLKLTIDPEPYINRYPRYGYYPTKNFLSFTAERRLTLAQLLELIEGGRKATPDLVLWSNITYAGDDGLAGWVRMAKACEDAGAHINELNMCCPNMSYNVELTGQDTGGPKTGASLGQNDQAIAEIVKAVKAATSIPLFVKITPEGSRQAQIAKVALDAGADGVGGNANRLAIPPIDIEDPTKGMYMLQEEVGMACMNGEWLKPLALRDVYEMRRLAGPDALLTATGGVTTWADAAEMMMCGADLVGICTATLVHGFGLMPEFIAGFRQYMKDKNYAKPRDMRDVLVPAITTAPDLTIYEGNAQIKQQFLSAPCTYACPNSVPAQGYVRKVAEEDFEEAYQLIMSRSPLQSICGKVCDHPCETACTRGMVDEAIRIRDIKRFVLELAEKEGWHPRILDARGNNKDKKVAVVGSGPAGIAAAYDLARAGYKVTVFEASHRLGGMLVSCIPDFRLSEKDIAKEIEVVKQLGVEFRTNTAFGRDLTVQGLKADGYEAVFLGIGAQEGVRLGIKGEDLPGCMSAVDFLKDVSEGAKPEIGKRVAVVGGGFTAIDASRTALRLGAQEVFILYRRTREEMPAADDEIDDAEAEGVKIMYLVSPQQIVGDGKVTGIRMLNYVLGEQDESARRRPVEVPGTEFDLEVDTVISAVSQGVTVDAGQDLSLTRWGTIEFDEKTGATNIAGVYAGGDCARGPQNIITAIADGKRAAVSIDRHLSGDDAFLAYDPEKTLADPDSVLARQEGLVRKPRVALDERDPSERIGDFEEYAPTMTADQAVEEAGRCLACGCGAGCEICKDICKVFAWTMDESGRMTCDDQKCVACGMCVWRCPNQNIEIVQTGTENLIR